MNTDLEKVILANVRTPDERKGDLGAQLAATLRATERLQELATLRRRRLIGYYGRGDGLLRAADAGARSPTCPMARAHFEDFCDGDGIADDVNGSDAPVPRSACTSRSGRPRRGRLRGQRPAS